MSQRITKRIGEIAKAIDTSPVRDTILKAAFEQFRTTGALPDNRSVARAVLRQCKTGLSASEESRMDEASLLRHLLGRDRPQDVIMDGLYQEAVADNVLVRDIARAALEYLNAKGFDVTAPVFARIDPPLAPPDFGTMGLWVLGFPEVLVHPPHEERALRLMDRFAELRRRVPQGNRWWFRDLATAARQFREFGVLPEDELVRECVHADVELADLLRSIRELHDQALSSAGGVEASACGVTP